MRWMMWSRRSRDCREVGRVLQRYLDGELVESESALVARHLEECRRCGLDARTYAEIKSSLAGQAPVVPAEQVDRLRAFADDLVAGGTGDDPAEDRDLA